jgi:hypothetical protein
MRQYLALEYRLQHMSANEGAVVVNTYLANLTTLETAIVGASANLDTASAGPWVHNANEQRDRERLFTSWRLRLCEFLGVPPGPQFDGGNTVQMVV